ncbi:MAG: FAD-binding protein [Acetobacteraceae bacterium]|nr:FAD-binding protein [Acetobacteraceae bacterium]
MAEEARITPELCDGCGECVRACPFFSVDVSEGKAVLAESCSGCGICVPACHKGAISVAGAAPRGGGEGKGRGVWVWAAGDRPGSLDPDSAAVAAAARAAAEAEGDAVAAVLPWEPAEGAPLAALGVDEVVVIPGAERPPVLAGALLSERPRLLLGPADKARRVIPGAAALAGVPFGAGVVELEVSSAGVEFTRPIYGGRFVARLAAASAPAVCTLDPRAYGRPRPGGAEPPRRRLEVEAPAAAIPGAPAAGRVERLDARPREAPVPLVEARLVVAGGRGLFVPGPASEEILELLARTAAALGGAPAADREAVEAGLVPGGLLVDAVAGATVAPDLYLALGVNGSATHNAAISRSKVIVAVTQNPAAPILAVADYVIPVEPLEALRALKGMAGG